MRRRRKLEGEEEEEEEEGKIEMCNRSTVRY